MKQEDCFELGHVTKSHGLEGFVTIFLDSDFPENYYQMESILLEQHGELVPFFIDDHKESSHPQKVHFLFEDIESLEDAKTLIGCKLFLPSEVLPELKDNQFYYHEIIGFVLKDSVLGELGPIDQVFENTGNDFFAIKFNNKEVLVPIEDAFILEVNRTEKYIEMQLPEGLLDL